MSLFQREPDPFSDELKKLEEEARRVEEKVRRLEARMGEAPPEPSKPSGNSDQFKGAMFKDGDLPGQRFQPARNSLKIQKRRIRNRVMLLAGVLFILILLLFRILA